MKMKSGETDFAAPFIVKLSGDASICLEKMSTITKRTYGEIMCDALRIYLWILHEQCAGRKIVAQKDGETPEQQELACLVANKKAAMAYFQELGWL